MFHYHAGERKIPHTEDLVSTRLTAVDTISSKDVKHHLESRLSAHAAPCTAFRVDPTFAEKIAGGASTYKRPVLVGSGVHRSTTRKHCWQKSRSTTSCLGILLQRLRVRFSTSLLMERSQSKESRWRGANQEYEKTYKPPSGPLFNSIKAALGIPTRAKRKFSNQ